jgi:hypothetical protein
VCSSQSFLFPCVGHLEPLWYSASTLNACTLPRAYLIIVKIIRNRSEAFEKCEIGHVHSCIESGGELFQHFLGTVAFTRIRTQQLLILERVL